MSDSVTESKFSTVMPYMKDSGQTSDSVFIETSSPIDSHVSQLIPQSPIETYTSIASSPVDTTLEQTPAPRRSARSTRGAPLYVLGKPLPIVLG